MVKDMRDSAFWSVGLVALALCATLARKLGYIDADAVTRIVLGATGLMVAWFGNRMPKTFVASASARKVGRVGGWSMALSGLLYAGLWAFAAIDHAVWIGCAALASGVVVTVVYGLVLRSQARAT
jgi:hypothetical protein